MIPSLAKQGNSFKTLKTLILVNLAKYGLFGQTWYWPNLVLAKVNHSPSSVGGVPVQWWVAPLWRPRPTGISHKGSILLQPPPSGVLNAQWNNVEVPQHRVERHPGSSFPANLRHSVFGCEPPSQRPSCAASCAVGAKDVDETATPAAKENGSVAKTARGHRGEPTCDRTIACSAGERVGQTTGIRSVSMEASPAFGRRRFQNLTCDENGFG